MFEESPLVLDIQNLSKNYGSIKALDSLNLKIHAGTVHGILGPNGSGKTTTLGILLGILKQSNGTFSWFEDKYTNPRQYIGCLLETPNFYPYLNAPQNLNIIRKIKGLPKQDFDEILHLINLYERRNSKFNAFSLGMRQRLAIGAALVGDPKVVIFDEPTNGLDPTGIAEVREILTTVADSGKTVIMASHILDEVEKVCSHVSIIKKGKLLVSGSINEILSDDITVEIMTTDTDKLLQFLKNEPNIRNIKETSAYLECYLDSNYNIESLSTAVVQSGMTITHLVSRKKKLEEEFLKITK